MTKYINANEIPSLFNEEYKSTMNLIKQGETYLDNLAEGFLEAKQVIDRMSSADVVKVTRCKNCVHGIKPDCIPSEKAEIKCMCNIDQKTHIGNFFCADGTPSIPYSEEETSVERK